jgi:hypothetical protein
MESPLIRVDFVLNSRPASVSLARCGAHVRFA